MQVPNQCLFGPKAAARYLGICEDTLKKITDLEQIPAFKLNGRRSGEIGIRSRLKTETLQFCPLLNFAIA
jgi:hypothetical protein